jgi:UDP:flavonoid glycosyltransferase YjiC (YdhE family)
VRITNEPVDIHQVASQARFVINHANHSTVATLCAAGVPQLLIPRFQEQLFLALQLVRQGCAAMAFQDQTGFSNAVTAMLNQPSIVSQAKQMASVITPFDENVARQHMRETFAKLLKVS